MALFFWVLAERIGSRSVTEVRFRAKKACVKENKHLQGFGFFFIVKSIA